MGDEHHELLCAYSDFMRRNGYDNTAEVALRTQSRTIRNVMAYVATYNRYSYETLEHELQHNGLPDIDYRVEWLASLGRVCALQAFHASTIQEHERDIRFGLACLRSTNRELPKDRRYQHFHRLEIELLIRQNRLDEARGLLEKLPYLREAYYGYLWVDLDNPVISGSSTTYEKWLDGFNRPFLENDLASIGVPGRRVQRFNDLTSKSAILKPNGPKVSVIMTSYRPSREDILNAVKSILTQSYRNLELIIVDDASPRQFDATLDEVVALDARIQLIKLPVNGGTYRARNAALAAARGKYVTCFYRFRQAAGTSCAGRDS